jgi:hypothetical protein
MANDWNAVWAQSTPCRSLPVEGSLALIPSQANQLMMCRHRLQGRGRTPSKAKQVHSGLKSHVSLVSRTHTRMIWSTLVA